MVTTRTTFSFSKTQVILLEGLLQFLAIDRNFLSYMSPIRILCR